MCVAGRWRVVNATTRHLFHLSVTYQLLYLGRPYTLQVQLYTFALRTAGWA
jgi:hypothetical protein